jgi:hypothetical protein
MLSYGPSHDSPVTGAVALVGFVVGGALMVWSSYIHFHLWQSLGYRHIATIGPLFLLQSIAGLVLGLLVIAVRRVWAAIVGIGFAAATMVGFFISVDHGLFGFKDSSSAPFAHQALILEICSIVALLVAGASCLAGSASSAGADSPPHGTSSIAA